MSPVARFDTDEKFWADWERNWLLYGTVYAINNPEPRIVPAETLTIHEGPCGIDVERLAEALNATVGKYGWARSTPADPVQEWLVNAGRVAHEYARLNPAAPSFNEVPRPPEVSDE